MFPTSRFSLIRKLHSAAPGLWKSHVERTAVKYPHVKRGNHAVLNDKDVQTFQEILGSQHHVLTDPEDVEPYNVDWMRSVRGLSVP